MTGERIARCSTVWNDKGTVLDLTAATLELVVDSFVHDCHRVKGHTGDHQCACGKKLNK